MNEEMLNLKPAKVFYYFNEITKIPRPSKKEEKISAWLEQTGKALGLPTKRDKVGNVLISKPATPGKENVTPVIFQAHMDMVCEKNNDTNFDFEKDAIQTYVDGEWLKAKGTTLGADDGIGVAMALAILDDKELEHGPIECLFTIDEETGLSGAKALEAGFMTGKMLINLDSEDEGQFFIGCAGGMDTIIKVYYKMEPAPRRNVAYNIMVSGLKGGHSGDDINKNLANANKLLTRILWQSANEFDLRIYDIQGGNLRNAIAREAMAVAFVPEEFQEEFEEFVKVMEQNFRREYQVTEPNLAVKAVVAETQPELVIDEMTQFDLLNALYACPHGVIAMSQTIPNFVETSTNLASVKKKEGFFFIQTSQRSSIESSKEDIANMVESVFNLANAEVLHTDGYPGWTPNPDSEIRKVAEECYKNRFGVEPKVKAIHAGLECGLVGDKIAGMDMISFGPTLRGVHSPDERIEIPTVQKFWDLLKDILVNAPKC